MVAKTITSKKNTEIATEKLLHLLRESDDVEDREFNIHNIIDQTEAIDIIKHYEEIIETGNKKTIKYEAVNGQILKKFKNMEEFIENI